MNERAIIQIEAPERSPSTRRHKKTLAVAALGLSVVGVSAGYSISHASTEESFGPHTASYSIGLNDKVIADFGPLGTAEHASEGLLPDALGAVGLGITIDVGEIPEYVPIGSEPTGTIGLLSGDAQSYVQFFAHPEVTINTVSKELIKDSLIHTALYTGLIGGGLASGYSMLGTRRRQELQQLVLQNHRTELATLGLVGLGLTGCLSGSDVQATPALPARSVVFDGTPLEGTRITGRMGQIVETYSSKVIEYINENNAYYGTINNNVDKALRYYSVPGVQPDKYITAVFASDLHCNTGMPDAIHTVITRTKAELYVDGGDATTNGTVIEKYCINAYSAAVPEGVEKVVSPGNHDSLETEQQLKDAGYTVLNGEVVTIGGLTFLGDRDPYLNRIGQLVQSVTDETTEQLGARLADTACDATNPVNLLIIHRPDAATESVESGCVDTVLSGHTHRSVGPITLPNSTVQYVNGTTGGASEIAPTIGAHLGEQSTMSVWLFNKDTKLAEYMRTITINPDGSVEISDWVDVRPSLMAQGVLE